MRHVDGVPSAKPLSRIGLGTWQFGSREWGYGDDFTAEAGRIVARAVDLGITLIDTPLAGIKVDTPAATGVIYFNGAHIAAWTPAGEVPASGYARLFHDHVQGADTGADFDFLTGRRGHEVPRDSH